MVPEEVPFQLSTAIQYSFESPCLLPYYYVNLKKFPIPACLKKKKIDSMETVSFSTFCPLLLLPPPLANRKKNSNTSWEVYKSEKLPTNKRSFHHQVKLFSLIYSLLGFITPSLYYTMCPLFTVGQ